MEALREALREVRTLRDEGLLTPEQAAELQAEAMAEHKPGQFSCLHEGIFTTYVVYIAYYIPTTSNP